MAQAATKSGDYARKGAMVGAVLGAAVFAGLLLMMPPVIVGTAIALSAGQLAASAIVSGTVGAIFGGAFLGLVGGALGLFIRNKPSECCEAQQQQKVGNSVQPAMGQAMSPAPGQEISGQEQISYRERVTNQQMQPANTAPMR